MKGLSAIATVVHRREEKERRYGSRGEGVRNCRQIREKMKDVCVFERCTKMGMVFEEGATGFSKEEGRKRCLGVRRN